MRHIHSSLDMVTLTYKTDIMGHVTKREREQNEPSTESSNGSRFKFWKIYNWPWDVLLKIFIASEQINNYVIHFRLHKMSVWAQNVTHKTIL